MCKKIHLALGVPDLEVGKLGYPWHSKVDGQSKGNSNIPFLNFVETGDQNYLKIVCLCDTNEFLTYFPRCLGNSINSYILFQRCGIVTDRADNSQNYMKHTLHIQKYKVIQVFH